MADRLSTSSRSEEILNELYIATKLEYGALARIAFAYSLRNDFTTVPRSNNISGKEIRRRSLFGTQELLYKSLLTTMYKIPLNDEEMFSNKSVTKDHIDNGLLHLWNIYLASRQDGINFMKELIKKVQIKSTNIERATNQIVKQLDVVVGKSDEKETILELNNCLKHANSHLAIIGKPGTGKTQMLTKVLSDVRHISNFETNFIFFDYKGDIISNSKFLKVNKVSPVFVGREEVLINPFILPAYDDQSIKISAEEKAESFASIDNKMGSVQKGFLSKAIRKSYEKRKNEDIKYPDFDEVYQNILNLYELENRKEDTLIEIVRRLTEFNLFWSHDSNLSPYKDLYKETLVIGLNELPVLKEMVAYLIIERLYKEMTSLPDSRIVSNTREIRTVLVIDEAHNYLCQKNIFLQRIIREGRSKGIAVFFASQSPNDYTQKFFDFKELLEFVYIFQCEGVSTSQIQNILGCSINSAKQLSTIIAKLPPGTALTKSNSKIEYEKFTTYKFYENY